MKREEDPGPDLGVSNTNVPKRGGTCGEAQRVWYPKAPGGQNDVLRDWQSGVTEDLPDSSTLPWPPHREASTARVSTGLHRGPLVWPSSCRGHGPAWLPPNEASPGATLNE